MTLYFYIVLSFLHTRRTLVAKLLYTYTSARVHVQSFKSVFIFLLFVVLHARKFGDNVKFFFVLHSASLFALYFCWGKCDMLFQLRSTCDPHTYSHSMKLFSEILIRIRFYSIRNLYVFRRFIEAQYMLFCVYIVDVRNFTGRSRERANE